MNPAAHSAERLKIHMEKMIAAARAVGASDLHIIYGLPPKVRVNGSLTDLQGYAAMTDDDCLRCAAELADGNTLQKECELDLAKTISGIRVRINLFRQQGHISAAIRLLRDDIPEPESLGLPPVTAELMTLSRGIVLVTGETGSGKSTTLAAMLQRINSQRREHIITLEDPIEYIYTPQQCIINQREVGKDTGSFSSGLRAALREDPDILLLGELRDAETIETALTAAETGHLLFATLHTSSAPDTVDRIVSTFQHDKQQQIRMQLSMTLQAVISQQLLPRADGKGRVLACEVMRVTHAIRNLIREGKTPQIGNALATTANVGNVTMDNCLIRLCQQRAITAEDAVRAAHDQNYVSGALMQPAGRTSRPLI